MSNDRSSRLSGSSLLASHIKQIAFEPRASSTAKHSKTGADAPAHRYASLCHPQPLFGDLPLDERHAQLGGHFAASESASVVGGKKGTESVLAVADDLQKLQGQRRRDVQKRERTHLRFQLVQRARRSLDDDSKGCFG